jgi:DNA-directed RNA polymerase specialized sigma24 family protein
MIKFEKLAQPELREKVTSTILEMLAHLPEAHKKMFVWKHYCGWQEQQIADNLRCSKADVENTLRQINLTLFQKTGDVLA